MIICIDCKHGGMQKYCQSDREFFCERMKTAEQSMCAFFEPAAREELREEEAHRKEPELF